MVIILVVLATTLMLGLFALFYLIKHRKYVHIAAAVASMAAFGWSVYYRIYLSMFPHPSEDQQWHVVYMNCLICASGMALVWFIFSGYRMHLRDYYKQYE